MTRIQELAEQAKNSIPKDSLGVSEWIAAYNQKFAELIVRECMNTIAESREARQTSYYYRNRVAEHFGVEE